MARSAPANPAFDFTARMSDLCAAIAVDVPQLAHVDMSRVVVAFSRCRKPVSHGLQATLTPMRFEGGARVAWRDGRMFTTERVVDPTGREMLYILTFYLPRFMDLGFEEKLVTVFHELWHISPEFDGDLRRHEGRCYLHTNSELEYDRAMSQLACRWLKSGPPARLYEFLNCDFEGLRGRFGSVVGQRVRHPRLIPVGEIKQT